MMQSRQHHQSEGVPTTSAEASSLQEQEFCWWFLHPSLCISRSSCHDLSSTATQKPWVGLVSKYPQLVNCLWQNHQSRLHHESKSLFNPGWRVWHTITPHHEHNWLFPSSSAIGSQRLQYRRHQNQYIYQAKHPLEIKQSTKTIILRVIFIPGLQCVQVE
jgi:hypothetical protein